MTPNGPVALTGATGFVGQAVLDEAERRGIAVKALTRRDQPARSGVEWVRGDLHDMAALEQLCSECEAVLHVAGVVNAADKAGFVAGNVEGTANVIAAAAASQVQRFTCVSSLSAREPHLSDYGWSKREAEKLVEASDLNSAIIRPPAIYGPRDTEMFELFRAARLGVIPMPPAGAASVIHVDDLARLLLQSTMDHAADWSGAVFEPDDAREGGWPHGELARAIGEAMDRNVFAPALPTGLLRFAAGVDKLFRGAKAKLTQDRVSYMVHPDWVSSPDKAVPKVLWQPQIETREGLRATAEWYRQQGWI